MSVPYLYITCSDTQTRETGVSIQYQIRPCTSVVDVIGNDVSTYEAGIHTLEMAPEHQSIKARLFSRVQNAYL